jgi:uncharacterized protein YecT (DUF1311 family)
MRAKRNTATKRAWARTKNLETSGLLVLRDQMAWLVLRDQMAWLVLRGQME